MIVKICRLDKSSVTSLLSYIDWLVPGSVWSGQDISVMLPYGRSEKLDLRSEEKLTQYSIFVFEGFGSSLSEFTKQVRNFEA